MNKLLFIPFFFCLSSVAQAQWTANGSNIYYSSGKVGIGTASPISSLHIVGDLELAAVSSSGFSAYKTNTNGGFYKSSPGGSGAFSWTNNLIIQGYTDGTNARKIYMATGLSPLERFSLDIDGTYTLSNTPSVNIISSPSATKPTLKVIGTGTGTNYSWISYQSDGTTVTSSLQDNGFLYLKGNVGIGTSSPSPGAKLEVNGDINAGSSVGTNTGYGTRLNLLGNLQNGDPLWISRYNNGSDNTELRINIGDDKQAGDMFVVGNHYWGDGVWYPYLTVQSSGNVGIGTASPDAKLAVKGQVHAQEVKVDLNVPGPDYVFEKDYKLPPLDFVKNYIDTNKHLPEVPSAKEM